MVFEKFARKNRHFHTRSCNILEQHCMFSLQYLFSALRILDRLKPFEMRADLNHKICLVKQDITHLELDAVVNAGKQFMPWHRVGAGVRGFFI